MNLYVGGLAQVSSNSSAVAMDLLQSCAKLPIYRKPARLTQPINDLSQICLGKDMLMYIYHDTFQNF